MISLHPARHNWILESLPAEEFSRLAPHLELVKMSQGEVVYEFGAKLPYVYFPATCSVSLLRVMQHGNFAEIASVGNEGVVGVAPAIGGGYITNRAVVKGSGYAYRLHEPIVWQATSRDGPLYRMLLRYTRTLIAQMAQLAACNTDHPVDKQFCRWLLNSLDQLAEKELVLPETLLTDMVGVPGKIVFATIGTLHHRGVIDYSPGHIKVLDRASLEGQACQCYQVVKQELEHLFQALPIMAR